MIRPNLLGWNARNVILTIIVFTILGLLSSCTKWIPDEYRNKVHFGELSRKRHISRSRKRFNLKKHSPSYGKYDMPEHNIPDNHCPDESITIVMDDELVNAAALDLTYTCPGK